MREGGFFFLPDLENKIVSDFADAMGKKVMRERFFLRSKHDRCMLTDWSSIFGKWRDAFGKTPKKYLFGKNVKKVFHPQHLYPPGREIRNELIFKAMLYIIWYIPIHLAVAGYNDKYIQ